MQSQDATSGLPSSIEDNNRWIPYVLHVLHDAENYP